MYQNITDISQIWPGITPFNVWDLPYDMWLLFTRKLDGPLPTLAEAAGENAQSRFVAQKILELREEGVLLSEVAVLFRSSFHSFDLEIELSKHGLPFIKRGGVKFIETAHVKIPMIVSNYQ